MKNAVFIILGTFFSLSLPTSASAEDFTISSISIDAFHQRFFCSAIGGNSETPTITIRHSQIGGQRIRVSMRDNTSNGVFDHYSTTVRSDPSGRTVINYKFRPPCNTTNGRVTSAYSIYAIAGDSTKSILWGRYP